VRPVAGTPCAVAAADVGPASEGRGEAAASADDVDRWLADKAKTLSTNTLQNLHSILKRSITRAQARDRVKLNVVLLCDMEEIARIAGHSSSRTTEVVYRRELRPILTTAAEAMDRLFNPRAS
jgi:hypothetical protein